MRWGILCWDRRSIGNNVGGGATALLFPPSKQPFRTVFRLAYSTGRGILDLVTAIVVCLAALGGIPKLPPQPLNAVLQPAPGQLPGRCLYLLLELLLYRGFFFYLLDGVSPPAKRGRAQEGPAPSVLRRRIRLGGLGAHEPVEVILGEMVHKGHDGAAALDEPPAKVHIGDVGKLVVRDIEQSSQLRPVRARLVEHDQEFAVGQHGAGRVGLEQIVHSLGQAGAAGPVLPYPLPEGEEEVGAVLMLKQQVG